MMYECSKGHRTDARPADGLCRHPDCQNDMNVVIPVGKDVVPTGMNVPDVALQGNNSQRLACALVLDGSSSMTEGGAIDELNAGLSVLEEELKKDKIARQRVQLSVIRFGDEDTTEVLSDWQDARTFEAPRIQANGRTPLGKAVTLALAKIEEQKARYKANAIAYNRPWLFLLTDGAPTDPDWEQAAAASRKAEQDGKVVFFGIGVGNANLDNLARFSNRPPLRLKGLQFKELFVWLSQSVRVASVKEQGSSVKVDLAPCLEIPT